MEKSIKVKVWIAFNKDLCNFKDCNILIFERGKTKPEDVIAKAACKINDCISLFGDFDMFNFRVESSFFEVGDAITLLMWPAENKEDVALYAK